MADSRKASVFALTAILMIGVASSLAAQEVPLRNWPAPATWRAAHPSGMRSLLTDVGNPTPFIPITPCRIADTRGNGFGGAYGPPAIGANTTRTFVIGGQCGIPGGAEAVSFNFAVLDVSGAGDLRVFPAGTPAPLVSTLNYNANTPNIANAAVVPLGAGGGITVQADATTINLIIDVNGYYSASYATGHTFTLNSGNSITASFHTTGGGEAVDSYCDTPSTNCWSYWTGTGTGNYAMRFASGRGSRSDAFDDGFGALQGNWTGAAGTANYGVIGTTSATGSCAAGVKGIGNGDVACGHFGNIGIYGVNLNGLWGVLGVSQTRGTQGSRVNASGVGQTFGVLGYTGTSGVHSFNDITAAGIKSFVEPHPYDATKQINFIAAEANEPLTMFRGRGRFQNGVASLAVPEEFQFVTEPDSLSIQITPIGDIASVAVTKIGLDGISLKSSRNVEFFYLVHGRRAGFESRAPIEGNVLYVPADANEQLPNYPLHIQKRLIAVGIYNPDGSVNMKTAEANGWAAQWRAREAAAKAARENQEKALHKDDHPNLN